MRSEEESEMARSNTETRYRVLFAGNEIGVWRDPECSAAWWLVDNRLASRDDVLRTYSCDLVVVAVPKGSVWSLTLSDLPNPRSTHATHAGARKAAAMIKAATSPAE
jgi:hypothetical protein